MDPTSHLRFFPLYPGNDTGFQIWPSSRSPIQFSGDLMAIRGRKHKPTAQKRLLGNPGKRPILEQLWRGTPAAELVAGPR